MKAKQSYKNAAVKVLEGLAERRANSESKKMNDLLAKKIDEFVNSKKSKKLISDLKETQDKIKALDIKKTDIKNKIEKHGLKDWTVGVTNNKEYELRNELQKPLNFYELVGRLKLQIMKAEEIEDIESLLDGAFGEGFATTPVSIDPPRLGAPGC